MQKYICTAYMVNNPEQKISKSGNPVTTFRISVKRHSPRDGEPKYCYLNCVAFKTVADYIYKFANSDSRIAIEGAIDTYSYTAKDGGKRYATQIIVDSAEILHSTVNEGDRMPQQENQTPDGFTEVDSADDLPFIM